MSDERDRLTVLEVEVKHLTQKDDTLTTTVAELRDLLIAAKGIRWFLGFLIALAGFAAGIAAKYLPHLPR
jgi:hypothetical protein